MMCGLISKYHKQSFALFLLRITLGSIFILHGGQKVLGLFGGPGLEGFTAWAGTMGISPTLAYLAAFAEFIGGILLLFGIATELGALLAIAVMIGAVFYVHWNHGYFIQNGGFEYPFNLILLLIASIVGGPGSFYIWDPCKKWRGCCTEKAEYAANCKTDNCCGGNCKSEHCCNK